MLRSNNGVPYTYTPHILINLKLFRDSAIAIAWEFPNLLLEIRMEFEIIAEKERERENLTYQTLNMCECKQWRLILIRNFNICNMFVPIGKSMYNSAADYEICFGSITSACLSAVPFKRHWQMGIFEQLNSFWTLTPFSDRVRYPVNGASMGTTAPGI